MRRPAPFHHSYFPDYTRAERIADAVVHLVGVPLGVLAAVRLLWVAGQNADAPVIASLAVYAAGLIGMLTASALYNLAPVGRAKAIFRRIDHAMIFVMIAGTYTPFVVNALGGGLGTMLAVIVWSGAVTGVVLKIGFPRMSERLSLALYLGLGWVMVVAIEPLARSVAPTTFWLLVAGGLVYTVGTVLHVWERLPFNNAGWHIAVLGGAACHFAAVILEFGYGGVLPVVG
ncbi:MAG: hemolysin III family protein [Caenispirillum bisanense]|nr:hemolysin III family protein [Caenispirillum bisanense]MCA1972328.1 hemolysin III family protein [Caenispirillum sp.]